MTITVPIKGGPAGAVSITTVKRTIGRVAMNVYKFDSAAEAYAAGFVCEGGPAMPMYEVSDAELASGEFVQEGDPKASAVYVVEAGHAVEGSYAIPVVVVNGALPQVAAPTFSPDTGSYSSAQTVTVISATAGASIRYTTDGVTTPTNLIGTVYSGPITISADTILQAIAYKTGMTNSTVSSATYNILNPNWYVVSSASRVHVGGLLASSFQNNSFTAGYTAVNIRVDKGCIQDGSLSQVIIRSQATATISGKVKVFRKNGASYDFIGESADSFVVTQGVNCTLALSTPIPIAVGDLLGFYGSNGNISYATATGTDGDFETGDIAASNALSSNQGAYLFDIDGFTKPPFLAATGDSLCQGVNNNPAWNPSSLTGTITGEVWHQLRGLIDSTAGAGFQYQNKGTGGTWALGASTGAAACAATLAKAVIFHYGVNDVNTGRDWADVAADMATCKAALGAGQDMWVDEIIPWNNGDDTKAATIRTFNANYAQWCTDNGAHLISLHDAMGQIRVSTGFKDDIITGYGAGDGVHLSQTGVNAMAALIQTALVNYYGYL